MVIHECNGDYTTRPMTRCRRTYIWRSSTGGFKVKLDTRESSYSQVLHVHVHCASCIPTLQPEYMEISQPQSAKSMSKKYFSPTAAASHPQGSDERNEAVMTSEKDRGEITIKEQFLRGKNRSEWDTNTRSHAFVPCADLEPRL